MKADITTEKQYYSLTENLKAFRKGMKGRKYKDKFPLLERKKHKEQYSFLKLTLKFTVKRLLELDYKDQKLLAHAVFNSFLSMKYRFKCLKQLLKTVFIYDKMD